MSQNQLITIKRILEVKQIQANQFNQLLDEGLTWDPEQGSKFVSNLDNLLLVGYYENQIAAFLTAYKLQKFDNKKSEVLLYEIGVNEQLRRKGIATALIEKLKEWSRKLGAVEIWVLTEQTNDAAKALYLSCGGKIENNQGSEIMYVFNLEESK